MLIHDPDTIKGVTGYQLVIVATVILGIIILALMWVFMNEGVDLSFKVFEKLKEEAKKSVCAAFGFWGQTLGKLFGC